jgi:electron transfer flavoprotein beta subunit
VNIIVLIKRVLDTAARVRIDEGARAASTRDVKFVMGPYDEIALQAAIRLREAHPGTEVMAACLGPDDAVTALRAALAMGADRALHMRVECPTGLELDGYQTASILAAELRSRPFDLLLFGRLAADDQSAQVGSWVARRLDVPSVAEVTAIDVKENRARFQHLVDGRVEVVDCELPAAATAQKGLAEPRYPTLPAILAAKKKPVEVITAAVPEAALETLRLDLPPPRKSGRIVGEGPEAVPELVRLLREEARVL